LFLSLLFALLIVIIVIVVYTSRFVRVILAQGPC
jgi:hypothetical protein